jgi:hypothetical protein
MKINRLNFIIKLKLMSMIALKSAWKYKIDLINIFDEKFLNEKDIALQPINFILEINDNIIQENVKTKNDSNNNLSIKKSKEEKDKSPKVKKSKKSKSKDTSRKKSIKNTSDLYSSNIVIVNSMTEDGSECSSINKIEREVAKLKRLMSRGRSKKTNKRSSKSKLIKNSHSAKY